MLQGLGTSPSHYFLDFLDTADQVFRKKYRDIPSSQRTQMMKAEHEQCLRFLRDHTAAGTDHFTVQNKITTWMQLLRMAGRYQE